MWKQYQASRVEAAQPRVDGSMKSANARERLLIRNRQEPQAILQNFPALASRHFQSLDYRTE